MIPVQDVSAMVRSGQSTTDSMISRCQRCHLMAISGVFEEEMFDFLRNLIAEELSVL
jgi:hypothetical protein